VTLRGHPCQKGQGWLSDCVQGTRRFDAIVRCHRKNQPGIQSHPLIASDRVERTAVRRTNGDRVGHIKRLMIDKVSGRAAPDAGTLVVVTGFLRSDFETRRTRIC
jgi:hypothetical protein